MIRKRWFSEQENLNETDFDSLWNVIPRFTRYKIMIKYCIVMSLPLPIMVKLDLAGKYVIPELETEMAKSYYR